MSKILIYEWKCPYCGKIISSQSYSTIEQFMKAIESHKLQHI